MLNARRLTAFASLPLFAVALAIAPGIRARAAGPLKLARHPDYHAGKIVFSYLGDIWIAGEDGAGVRRVTDHSARETFPRFSPDGRWIAFSSDRYGDNDVFVVPVTGGASRRLTFHPRPDDVVGWSRESARVIFRGNRGDGVFGMTPILYEVEASGGPEKPLPLDSGFSGSYSPDGRSFVFNRRAPLGEESRRHYRGSAAADLWIADLAMKTYSQLLPGERYNRMWPMWAADGAIYFVADALPNDRSVEPGSAAVRKSVNNIYKVPARGADQPVQVTKHTSGNLYWPSMSSDGKVIVYEENFGLWKLDVASGRTTELGIEITSDEKENELEYETITNEVGAFDISPSGRRAVISARGQLLTIATERGDIARLAPDAMASRNDQPKWSPDGRHIAFVSDRSGRNEVWISDPEGRSPKQITSGAGLYLLYRDDPINEKGALVWTPDSSALFYTTGDSQLYRYTIADQKTALVASSDDERIGSVSISPDSKWVMFSKPDRTLRWHVYIAPIAGGEARHISDDRVLYSENNAVFTADGRYAVFTSTESLPLTASRAGFASATTLWSVSLRDRDRDPADRDVDNEAEGLAAATAARPSGRGGGPGAAATPPDVQIDWSGIARRARQITLPGTPVGGLAPASAGHAIAVKVAAPSVPAVRGAMPALGAASSAIYIVDAETGESTRVPAAPQSAEPSGRGRGRGRGGAPPSGGSMVFSRDGRTLYFSEGNGLYVAPIRAAAGDAAPPPGAGRGGGAQAALRSDDGSSSTQTARRVTYTATLEIDRRALRRQVFNEGWRILKDNFYDAQMHGVDWNAVKGRYAPLLDNLTESVELHDVMMMMIGELNASHTAVRGGRDGGAGRLRHPGFDVLSDPSGFYRVGHIYREGPADKDFLKIKEGDVIVALDGHELKTSDNYWRAFTLAHGAKLHFLINDKPGREGAWEVTITPAEDGAFGDLLYRRWVDARREIVRKLSNDEIGYLHIRAMNDPSLRQFQLDLATNLTKKALIIDERFNGGGHISQDLLAILSAHRQYVVVGRDQKHEHTIPMNFYGPMVLMQNERSMSNAEIFPAGFKALGLGKVIGVPTRGAVIGMRAGPPFGLYVLLDGAGMTVPGYGIRSADGRNLENYGVPPDVYVDNTPEDFVKGRDAQIEKAIEVLKAELAKKTPSTSGTR